MSRVLGRIRLSRSSDESTSIERQREIIQQWASANGHTVIGWAEDIDVSGAVSPFEAPALAPWFQEPKSREWDILVAWKLDRLSRRSIPTHELFSWIQNNGKTLVCVADNIDLSTWVGRLVASVIAGVAEGELEAIRERATSSQKKLRQLGRWGGGRTPYGWRPVASDTGEGYVLEHDPVTVPVVRRIVHDYLGGLSADAIAAALTNEQIPTPKNHDQGKPGGVWNADTIRGMLRSRALLGWTMHNKQPVLDAEGKPILKGPPAITVEEYNRIQEIMGSRRSEKTNPDRTSPLLGVLVCWHCGGNLHIAVRNNPNHAPNYECPKKCGPSLNGNQMLELVYDLFEAELGDYPVTEKQVTRANDLSSEIEEARAAYDDLAGFISTAGSAESRRTLFSQLEMIEQRIKALQAQSTTEDTVEWVKSGQTYRELWDTLDEQGRRQLMVKAGVTVRARPITRGSRWGYGIVEAEIRIPDDLRERLRAME